MQNEISFPKIDLYNSYKRFEPKLVTKEEEINFLPKLIPPFPFKKILNSDDIPLQKKLKEKEITENEERIVNHLLKQTNSIEDLLVKFKNKEEKIEKKIDKQTEKFDKKNEKMENRKINYNHIAFKIEEKFKHIMTYGLDYNPYFPFMMPFFVFNCPKNPDKSKRRKKKKSRKKNTKD